MSYLNLFNLLCWSLSQLNITRNILFKFILKQSIQKELGFVFEEGTICKAQYYIIENQCFIYKIQ